MSFAMGVMENMVHAESSSKVKPLKNGSEEKNVGSTVLQNGSWDNGVMTRLKFKRRHVFANRDFPPGCGPTNPKRLSKTTEVDKSCENGNVAIVDKVESTKDEENVVELDTVESTKDEENVVELDTVESKAKDEENVPVVDKVEFKAKDDESLRHGDNERPCIDMDTEVSPVVESIPEDRNVMENTTDVSLVELVEVQPLSVCLPNEDDVVGSVGQESKKPFVGREADVLRDSEKGSKYTLDGERIGKVAVSMGKNVVLKNSGSGARSRGRDNMVRDMVDYQDDKTMERDDLDQSEPLETDKSNATVPKPCLAAGRQKAKKVVPYHSAVKLTKKNNQEYGEGSKMKKSERASPEIEDFPHQEIARRHRTLNVGIPPSRPSGSSSGEGIRNKVKETLRLFYGACRKLTQEQEAKPKIKGEKRPRVDCEAANILKSKGKYLNYGKRIVGAVPGIEVGDEFQFRIELNILGIHKQIQGGIDYMKDGVDIFATSIVASGAYDDELDNSDILIYTGQGGNVIKNKQKGDKDQEPKDQKLVTGNLALANSINKKNPVRVIRGNRKAALESSGNDGKSGKYVYDGLYLVEAYWQETGSHGKKVFKYRLKRIPGQPELSWKVVKQSTKSKYREGLCKLDISEGKERLPISAVNEIDDEKPPSFIYTTEMIYPDWCRPLPPKSCDCTSRCIEARNCACVARNGGEIPYNYDGAIVGMKPLIYECGPLCKCPPSCYLRVAQRGIKFQLEIFKTTSRGWGVRSLQSIPSGSFICEYVGELLEDNEAERRTGNDEYLFDIGNQYDDPLAEEMSKLMPESHTDLDKEEDDTSGFTIDAAEKGNIGRFINHSCSPNLYAQNVLYDHEDKRIPHVMFFAMDNIPPLQELCYHYNYTIDQVRDSNGNIKKKYCYCGSSDCTGRLY